MHEFFKILPALACGCVLPIVYIWFETRRKMNDTNQRTQIVLAAIEKNPDMDLEELMAKISPKKKLLKERLLTKLLWGGIIAFVGFSIFASNLWLDYLGGADPEMLFLLYISGGILFGIGLAFIASQMPNKQAGDVQVLFEIRPEVNYVTHLYTLAGLGFSDDEYTAKYGNTLPKAAVNDPAELYRKGIMEYLK